MIGHHHVPGLHRNRLAQPADAEPQGAEMDGDVRRVDHQLARRIQQGAREVEPLLDVGGDRRALKPLSHLPRDGREAVGEQLQLDGFGPGVVDWDDSLLRGWILG